VKKLLYITNIPAPYRQKRFNKMAEIFPKYGIELEVLYMAKIEPDRKWIIPEDSYKYNYKIYKGIHPTIGNFFAHFNPGLLWRLRKKDYDIAIVGGMGSPTHWLAPFFIPKSKIQVMSIESNLHSVERTTGVGAKIKKLLLSKSSAYQVTGNPQKEYIEFFYPKAREKQYITLPNLIDESVFRDEVAELRINRSKLRDEFGVGSQEQMWVLPARLIPLKGILPFLELLKGIKGFKLFLLGDGELENIIMDYIKSNNLPVILSGFVQQEDVIKYYAAADLFVLPSLKDPSPLSPIEAIASGLPILVSSRIGNLEDVLVENVNGWTYDPVDEVEKGKRIVKEISLLSNAELKVVAKNSLNRYNDKFETEECIAKYVKQLKNLIN
jgi:glycosyltransferase involved in cell wall biosynthesis